MRKEGAMPSSANRSLNQLLIRLAVRAEQLAQEFAEQTFVEVSEVTYPLQRIDHQVLYGRRGAGKTHAFAHLAASAEERGDLPIYIDLRSIGSSGGIYGDTSLSPASRGTHLLVDVLAAVHEQLLTKAVEFDAFAPLLEHLDPISEAINEVRVEGPVTLLQQVGAEASSSGSRSTNGTLGAGSSAMRVALSRDEQRSRGSRLEASRATKRTGSEVPRVIFGSLGKALRTAAESLSPRRIWLLLDEWSSLPMDMQPLLADMLRRSLFPCQGITVKIGAIERRCRLRAPGSDRADYIGLELGADTAAALDLDAHITDAEVRSAFFPELLYRHLVAMMARDYNKQLRIANSKELANVMFETPEALRMFIRAAEGVPRDALQIAAHAAQKVGPRPVDIGAVRSAAWKFYNQDKLRALAGNKVAMKVWAKLQGEVVVKRRSRTFVIRRDRENASEGFLDLYDARLIHLLEPGIVFPADPGTIYDGYSLDFGSCVKILEEGELDRAYELSARLWDYDGEDPILTETFDFDSVFDPSLS